MGLNEYYRYTDKSNIKRILKATDQSANMCSWAGHIFVAVKVGEPSDTGITGYDGESHNSPGIVEYECARCGKTDSKTQY